MVNGEQQSDIAEPTDLSGDLANTLAGTEVHTIPQGSDQCVRKFTPKAAAITAGVLEEVARAFEEHGLRLLVEPTPGPLSVPGDSARLQ